MSEALYEQYKAALRRGHVAALRGRLDAAEAAYRAASVIAPDRALPFASLGDVLRRQGLIDASLVAYGSALARAPRDEGSLRGRAELHADAGRRTDAALDYEALAEVLEVAGRLTDACDAARRALELAESRSRRREMERLSAQLRERGGDDRTAAEALDDAFRILDADEVPPGRRDRADANATDRGAAARVDAPGGELAVVDAAVLEPDAAPSSAPDPAIQRAVADALLDSGDIAGAAVRLLALAALHRADRHHDAAMDACLALVAVTPSHHRLQLEIAAIQLDRGWVGIAAEKVRLLARLANLDADADAAGAVAAFATAHGLEPPESSAGPA